MKKILIDKINSLPPLPQSVIELEKFKSLDKFDIEELVEIINKDPLMVATILRVANSSMFGFRSQIETLSRAINLLGINFSISVAIGVAIQHLIPGNLNAYNATNDDFLYISSLSTNLVNIWISSMDFDLKNELLLPSFLQEIGKYVISDIIESNGEIEAFQKDLEMCDNISLCENKFTGYTCSRVTANVFKHWGLSHKIIFPIAFVDTIDSCPKDFLRHSQVLEIVKILTDIRAPLSDKVIIKAINKASLYGFNIDQLTSSIDILKESEKNSI